jgi:hypothetical protein
MSTLVVLGPLGCSNGAATGTRQPSASGGTGWHWQRRQPRQRERRHPKLRRSARDRRRPNLLPAGEVSDPVVLAVNVIDPAVIDVDRTVDGATTVDGGTTLDTSGLAAGSHTMSARASDHAGPDLVRHPSGR